MAKKSTFDKFISNLIGFNKAKRNIAKATGIPTTKYGQKAKLNRIVKKAILLSKPQKRK